jgi:tetratricopeptide (TPR) repeat protein
MKQLEINSLPEVSSGFDLIYFQNSIRNLRKNFEKYDFFKTVTDEQVEVIYSVGHALFMQGKFEKALNIFQLILIYRPLDARSLEACATTMKRLGRFDEAIPIYAAALVFGEVENPMPSMHIAECLAALGRNHDSETVLRPILDASLVDSAYADVQSRARNLLSMLKASA